MKLGILGAMDCEVSLLRDKMTLNETVNFAGNDYHIGKLGNLEVILAGCGIGKVNAAICTVALIEKFGATHIINTGVAGGVTPDAKVLDVIISSSVCYHDFTPGILSRNFPFCEEFEGDKKLIEVMTKVYENKERNYRFCAKRIVTGDVFVEDSAVKESIASRFTPGCVDMESAAVGQVCYIMKTPFITLRALSDSADDDAAMSFDQFAAIAADNSANLLIDFCNTWEA